MTFFLELSSGVRRSEDCGTGTSDKKSEVNKALPSPYPSILAKRQNQGAAGSECAFRLWPAHDFHPKPGTGAKFLHCVRTAHAEAGILTQEYLSPVQGVGIP